jgi:hypothetical protein
MLAANSASPFLFAASVIISNNDRQYFNAACGTENPRVSCFATPQATTVFTIFHFQPNQLDIPVAHNLLQMSASLVSQLRFADPLCLSTHADRMPFDQILPRACNLDKGRKLLKRNHALSGALPAYGHEFDGSFKAGWFSMLGLRGEVCLVMGVQTVLMRHDAIAPKDSRTCDDPVQSTARSRLRNSAVRSLPVFCAQPSRWIGHTGTSIPMCLWPQPPRVVGHGQAKVFAQRLGFFHTSHLRVRMAGPPIC